MINLFFLFQAILLINFNFNFKELNNKDADVKFLEVYNLVIFYQNQHCMGCMKELNENIKSHSGVNPAVICRTPDNFMCRKKMQSDIYMYFGKVPVYFENNDSTDLPGERDYKSGVFGAYKIYRSPTIMILDKDSIFHYYDYDELFNGNVNLNTLFDKYFK